MPKVSIIVAVADNYAIGKNNKLPWHLPADLKRFKELTTGHAVVMGKRTFESLPNGPLPNRKNIVLTTILEGDFDKYYEATSLRDALELCEKEKQVFIIGGASVFKQALDFPDINTMYITWIHASFEADIYFPKFDTTKWKEISREDHQADEKNPFAYSFCEYKRIKK
ncbi:Dihydrofolate reductase [uncultured Paludibacter sp.]|uniref:Dihydrofolate reductase n=1 Tax=uncultured Paludibacter sp. TaxID=497635 RepID=A0A653AC45_9BACT|nr:Dihydrofolate reductase [uncultured Paludibacter sp.]